ncbi:LCP family protein [Promicromonospora sukumoe]|uniref:LCP family protein required for cell wall assembly n=1 Tax=Promicromonospora sukumoe TaxID=88382 RepID=A0A7W3PCC7_9MICO|nr:LCP family protein [Promicromonospora sukumoe]MBA8806339.1 LCP family protein required for cell wall assembly [Promicromonospora sukumoe]
MPRHLRHQRSHRAARAAALVVVGALALVAAGGAAAYLDLKQQIGVSDVSGLVKGPTPSADPDDPFTGRSLNILVMGTDLRGGENTKIAGEGDGGMRSDTTMLVHVSGDRSRMEVVSIPRDSLVDIPSCKLPDGSESGATYGMFNSAFTIGGGAEEDLTYAAACTISAVQTLTGVPVTNHMVVKMDGVVEVVEALGGVRMCLPEPLVQNPAYGRFELPAGEQTLDGRQAIGFLRARHGTGLGLEQGSDLTRIERQQAFVDALVRQILDQNVVTNSPRLYRTIEAVLRAISADPGLADPAALAGLAFSIRDIDPSEIVFTELPVVAAPTDPNRVVWTEDAAAIWERLAADEPPPGHKSSGSGGGSSDKPSRETSGGASDEATDEATSRGTDGATSPSDTPSPSPSPSLLPGVCAD